MAALPAFLAGHGDWYLNGGTNFFDGRPVWGYAECATVDEGRTDLIVVMLTDPTSVAAFRTTKPITDAPLSLTLSRSFTAAGACAVCAEPAAAPKG